MNARQKGRPITKLQNEIFGAMVFLTVCMTLFTTIIGIYYDLSSARKNLDNNLLNIAYAVTKTETIREGVHQNYLDDASAAYLRSIKDTSTDVDVISVISSEGIRLYHTNNKLIGSTYDGTSPDFIKNGDVYVTSDVGPSGSQRRVYAAVYSDSGEYEGFILVVLLNQNIYKIIAKTVFVHLFVSIAIIAVCVLLSKSVSGKIKHKLWGYEPDAFSAMYSVRDNILESFEEGIIAIDYKEKILFMNKSAQRICNVGSDYSLNIRDYSMLSIKDVRTVLKTSERLVGVSARSEGNIDAIVNYYPVIEDGNLIGALCVLVDRTEYTRIAEDLSGVKFLVDSMRANNHDFTNKLHVILGLIQMGAYKDAMEYIGNITTIQQKVLSDIMRNIEDPSVAALLIGKYSKAAELNINFTIEPGSQMRRSDVNFSSSDLITIIGNLIENSFEAMNNPGIKNRELAVGIFTKPGAMIIRIDDSGIGIPDDIKDTIYMNGVTSKGENHGTGLFLVKQIVNRYNGEISFESESGEGTSFLVSLIDNGGEGNV